MLKSWCQRVIAGCVMAWMFIALSGCTTGVPPAPKPPLRWQQAAVLVAPDHIFTMSDGAALPARIWKAQGQPKAVLLALHGFNDSRDAWESRASFFTQAGVTVAAPDQRGFGAAPQRGAWAGTARMVADTRELIDQLKKMYPRTPIYLAGESMGGAVLMVLMAQPDAPAVAGTILLAPAVWDPGFTADMLLSVFASLSPHTLVPEQSASVHVVATDNMAALIRLYYDPLTLRTTQWIALRGLVTLMQQAAAAAKHDQGNILCVYGDNDQLVPAFAMARVWHDLSVRRTEKKDTRFDMIPGGHHLLLRDQGGERVAHDMLSWMTTPQSWLPSGGDVSAGVWVAEQKGLRGPGKGGIPFFIPARLDEVVTP